MIKDKLKIVKGEITQMQVDAIVNAANTSLLGGGGVDGAIHRVAGPGLLEECKKLEGCVTGSAKITGGYQLPARYVIHAVGPVWRGGAKGEPQLLASCYATTLKLASKHEIKTLAFPAISCGVYGYPVTQAATIALKETADYLELHPEIDVVYFVCFDESAYEAYLHAFESLSHD